MLSNDDIEKIYRLSLSRFKKIFGRRMIQDGYFNPTRSFDEHIIGLLMLYYQYFRKRLWK